MTYDIRKAGNKFEIVKEDTGEVVGTSDKREKAERSILYREKLIHKPKKIA